MTSDLKEQGFEPLWNKGGDEVIVQREKKQVSIDLNACLGHWKNIWCPACWPRVVEAVRIADEAMKSMMKSES